MKTVIFDFDGTLHQSSNMWRTIWHKLGYPTHRESYFRAIFNAFKEGELTHKEWTELTCKAFRQKGLTQKKVWDYAKDITLLDGAQELFQALKENGYCLYIVSGNIEEVIKIALGNNQKYFSGICANKFVYDKRGNFKTIEATTYDYEGKAKFIEKYKQKTGSMAQDIIFVGDGDNDEWAHLSGCRTICFNPHSETDAGNKTKWHRVVFSDNLASLIPEIMGDEIENENV
ncbi:MAG: HAD-IB family phosphatase [Clostridia bacterium]|nr:HAD-IB family phosphatase [Clostridia bacterium]